MLGLSRKNEIKNLISKEGNVIVAELSGRFNVSDETIRKDLKQLEDEGFLRRIYGGATVIESSRKEDAEIRERLFVAEKDAIAQLCLPLIKNNDSIFLDGSTTAICLAKQLMDRPITVITNSMIVADIFSNSKAAHLVVIGGLYETHRRMYLGKTSELCIKEYVFDKSFISCETLHLEHGITDSSESHAVLRRLAIEQSHEAYLITDHTKFNKTSLSFIAPLESINTLITNKPLSQEWIDLLKSNDIPYLFPPVK